ncbi:uncharacterized protein BT62DRAFT_841374, partial [Guyanagaster necrorhizus]
NDAPVCAERAELEAVIREGEQYLAFLQQRISQTQNTLDSLLKEQNRAVKHIADSKLVLNPVHRLPPDILSHIFLLCIFPDSEPLHITNSPWNLSYVSSRWRQVALTTPSLWSFIGLQL